MSKSPLDLTSRDELITSLLTGNKPSVPKETPVGERKTFKVKSDLLSRLEDFLPKLKEANNQLDKQMKADPKAVDIENVDEESGEQYIEMDLGLGVFDLKKDVKEEDIIINPSDLKAEATSTKKPTIVMMDTDNKEQPMDEDSSDSDSESEESHKEKKIPARSAPDDDVVMSS